MRGSNDNFNPWSSIGLQANLILNKIRNAQALRELVNLDEKEKEQDDRQTARDRTEKEKLEAQREYVERRLRELAAWERRLGIVKRN